MSTPKTASQLQQFLCAMQWVRMSIPECSSLMQPLRIFLNTVLSKSTSRSKRSSSRISLQLHGWGQRETYCFMDSKKVIANQLKLAHRDAKKRLCLFTDASNECWSGLVTQIPMHQVGLSHHEQNHEPLAFLSGHLNTTQLGWPTLEKESFGNLASTPRMHWLVACPEGFDLYTDHNHIIFIFDPLATAPDLSMSSVRKVLCWAVSMSLCEYLCFHKKGKDNVWADILSRCTAPIMLRRLISIPPLVTSCDEGFEWPIMGSIRITQAIHEKKLSSIKMGSTNIDAKMKLLDLHRKDGILRKGDLIRIPDEDEKMQLRICVIGHTDPAGRRGYETTLSRIKEVFTWTTMKEDIRTFIQKCIHCLSTSKGLKEPRPFGPSLHGKSSNDLLQFDFLEMGPGSNAFKYILMIRVYFSSYSWFLPFDAANAEDAADALLEWCTTFSVPNGLMSDEGTHFRNETVRMLVKSLRVPHHFTLPYTPWSNGGIERLGKEILRMFRAALSELQLQFTQWPVLVPVLQSALNNSLSPQRKGYAPITIFTGHQPVSPLNVFKHPDIGKFVPLPEATKERVNNIIRIKELCNEIHPLIEVSSQKLREKNRQVQSRGKLLNFEDGDFVLLAKDDHFKGQKLALRWRGPRQIVKAISKWIYVVRDLRNNTTEQVHVSRLRFYNGKYLDQKAIMPHVIYSETGMPNSRLMNLEKHGKEIMVHVRWKALPNTENILEPLRHVYEDVPEMLQRFLKRKNLNKKLVAESNDMIQLWKNGV